MAGIKKVFDTETFILKSKEKYGDKFDYTHCTYVNAKTKVKLICTKHDFLFEITPDSHNSSRKGSGGCPQCHRENMGQYHRLSVKDFVEKAKEIHGDTYDYSQITEFRNAHTKVPIVCKVHGLFYQTVSNHIYNKFGCKHCAVDYRADNRRSNTEAFIESS